MREFSCPLLAGSQPSRQSSEHLWAKSSEVPGFQYPHALRHQQHVEDTFHDPKLSFTYFIYILPICTGAPSSKIANPAAQKLLTTSTLLSGVVHLPSMPSPFLDRRGRLQAHYPQTDADRHHGQPESQRRERLHASLMFSPRVHGLGPMASVSALSCFR
jgi:hypothetical protein